MPAATERQMLLAPNMMAIFQRETMLKPSDERHIEIEIKT